MNNHEILDGLAEASEAIRLSRKASQALIAFGKIAMPEMQRADEQLNGTMRSEVATVFEFFGELISKHTNLASELVDQVGVSLDRDFYSRAAVDAA